MARGKRNVSPFSLEEEIQKQGILVLLERGEGSSAKELREQFSDWLRNENTPAFTQLIQEFAAWKVEEEARGLKP